MNNYPIIRLLLILTFSLLLTCSIYFSAKQEKQQKYTPYSGSMELPAFLIALIFVAALMIPFSTIAYDQVLFLIFDITLLVSIYIIVLRILMPILRQNINARVCAYLWLLPNFLYITHHTLLSLDKPSFIIYIPSSCYDILFYIWFTGFIVILGYRIITHIHFTKKLINGSNSVNDPRIIFLWYQILDEMKMGHYIRLMTSSKISSPLSIGFFKRTTSVILPNKQYTDEELTLLFKHELIHVSRRDSSTKFYLFFCQALCWFNPFVWQSLKKSLEDLELSCDETVLLDANQETRQQYANLILNTAGDDTGFSSCLSSSAQSLQYRLINILHPSKKKVGALLTGLIFFVLVSSSGHIALASRIGQAKQVIFHSNQYNLQFINSSDTEHLIYYQCNDENKLFDYLSSLELYRLAGNYSFNDTNNVCRIAYQNLDELFVLSLNEHTIKITTLNKQSPQSTVYYLKNPINWAYLYSLLSS